MDKYLFLVNIWLINKEEIEKETSRSSWIFDHLENADGKSNYFRWINNGGRYGSKERKMEAVMRCR